MKKIGQYALVTACVAGALLLATRPAQAEKTTNGLGTQLLFSYWTTERERDTYISIQSPLGVQQLTQNQRRNVVRIVVRAGDVPGFTTTAASTAHNAGGVNDPWRYLANNRDPRPRQLAMFDVCLLPGDTWTATITANAAGDGSMLRLGDPGQCDGEVQQPAASRTGGGRLRTPTRENPTVMLDATTGIVDAYPIVTMTGSGDMATSSVERQISGIGYLVSPTNGFAAVYAADSFTGTGCTDAADCNSFVFTGDLHNEEKNHLIGRWVTEPIIGASTDIVVTFPGMHVLNFQTTRDENTLTMSDPLSLYVFDEAGNSLFTDHDLVLTQSVNICRFEMMENNMTQVTCNDEEVGTFGGATGGSFRIVNSTDKTYGGASDMGTEPEGNDAFTTAAQTSEEQLSVTGFVLSFFDVSSGKYDMLVPLRWITQPDPQ